jgi:hypothetical protein
MCFMLQDKLARCSNLEAESLQYRIEPILDYVLAYRSNLPPLRS